MIEISRSDKLSVCCTFSLSSHRGWLVSFSFLQVVQQKWNKNTALKNTCAHCFWLFGVTAEIRFSSWYYFKWFKFRIGKVLRLSPFFKVVPHSGPPFKIFWTRSWFTLDDKNLSSDPSYIDGLATNGWAHLSSLLTKWLVFLMSTVKGKVSLPQHSVDSLQPSMSTDVHFHLIIELFSEHSSSSVTSLLHYTKLMSDCFLFATFSFAIVSPRS